MNFHEQVRYSSFTTRLSAIFAKGKMEDVTKAQIIEQIKEGLAEAEEGVRHHPSETISLFELAKTAFRKGRDIEGTSALGIEIGLNEPEFDLVIDYLFTMAFISGWFHVHGDRRRRDSAAQTASLLVSGLGIAPEVTMKLLIQYEERFREGFKAAGIGRKRSLLPVIIIAIVVITGIVAYYLK